MACAGGLLLRLLGDGLGDRCCLPRSVPLLLGRPDAVGGVRLGLGDGGVPIGLRRYSIVVRRTMSAWSALPLPRWAGCITRCLPRSAILSRSRFPL